MEVHVPVHLEHVPETDTWDYLVEEPHVVGGGCRTRDEARQHAAEAIAFALEEPGPKGDVEYVSVAVALA